MVKGWCPKHGDWNNWKDVTEDNCLMCPYCLKESKRSKVKIAN